jgi:hypothetical protein
MKRWIYAISALISIAWIYYLVSLKPLWFDGLGGFEKGGVLFGGIVLIFMGFRLILKLAH